MCKKYQEYKVKVTYKNGDTEIVKGQSINTNNYKQMLEVYRTVKDTYDTAILKQIEFLGIGQNQELGVLFTKQYIEDKEPTLIEENTIDILQTICQNIKLLTVKKEYHKSMIPCTNKKLDVLYHQLEDIDLIKKITETELRELKLSISDQITYLRKLRRWHNNELSALTYITNNKINNNVIANTLSQVISAIDNSKTKIKFPSWNLAKKKSIYEEQFYTDDINKNTVVNNLKDKYKHVYIDEVENKVIAYNNAG
ncbi:MAG: hypothetical protein ACRCVJ_11750 [Clostridium sp.]|uniref:hypothetical protein n=1 Tax=Clostridium sp. TaxID=1506 RepID=UPI003F396537